MARGERARCKRVVGGLASVDEDGEHRAAATPAPTRTPPPPTGPASTRSAASGRWSVVPGLETGDGGGGGAGCALPPQPECGGGLYAVPPPQLDLWVGLCHAEMGAVFCHADRNW